jgi:hypothetical protein
MEAQIEAEKPKEGEGGGAEDQWSEYDPAQDRPDLKVVRG